MKKICGIILPITLIVLVAFIWIHSALPVSISSEESGRVTAFLLSLIRKVFPNAVITDHFTRKCAHAVEYACLGAVLALFWGCRKEKFLPAWGISANTALIVAFLDESIQVLSGRGPRIPDVWLDLISASVFAAIALAIIFKRKNKDLHNMKRDATDAEISA